MTILNLLIVIGALAFLMYMAYKGHSVILFAPIAAMGAVLLTRPSLVGPMFSGLFMSKLVGFVQNYFPVFLLGALFGKVIELSGYAKSIVNAIARVVGAKGAIYAIVIVCMLLTYFGVSLFVVVFAVYPFAAEMFRQADIPKRLIPGTIALGAFTVTMDALPGTMQIQNIIPTTFFKTTTWAAPILGLLGSVFVLALGFAYLEWQRRRAEKAGEGYGADHKNEPIPFDPNEKLPHWALAITPLILVGVVNFILSQVWLPKAMAAEVNIPTSVVPKTVEAAVKTSSYISIWSVIAALLVGIVFVVATAWKPVMRKFTEGSKDAIGGALLASLNTASEYGFGGVIAALPGFALVAAGLSAIKNPLLNEAISINLLAGVTGSASGGMSIALGALANQFIEHANAAGIPMDVLHRVASMASGGMDTLPHNGAVITLLAVTGLTHKSSYKDVFAMTCIKTLAVFFVIGFYLVTKIY